MKIFKILFVIFLFPLITQGQEIDDDILESKHYKKKIAQFKANPIRRGKIVFFGNSITEAGKWASYFPTQSPVNRGISGDNTDGMLARVHEVISAQPSKIFIMAGINDISLQRENEVILRQIKLLIRQIVAGCPNTKIYIQSTLPLNSEKLRYSRLKDKEIQILDYNQGLKALCEEMGIDYIDIYTHLTDDNNNLKAEYTSDGLHINQSAYQIWSELIKEYIVEQ